MLKTFNTYSGYLALAVSSIALTVAIKSANREMPKIDYTQINNRLDNLDDKHEEAKGKIIALHDNIQADKNAPIIVDVQGRPIVAEAEDMHKALREASENNLQDAIGGKSKIDPNDLRFSFDPTANEATYHPNKTRQAQDLSEGKEPSPPPIIERPPTF